MTIQELKAHITQNSQNRSDEFKRLFHGRGGFWEEWRHFTLDSIDLVLSAALYFKEENEEELLLMLKEFALERGYETLVVQRRYLKDSPSEILIGELPHNLYAVENGLKYKLNLLSNQNTLFFADMKNGRTFVRENAKDKSVLNLFSYTCSFSVAAKAGGALKVSNIDMSKASLSAGKANHHLNSIDPKGVSFLPYNILKSFSRIKQNSPYDLIIIDPPTLQKGSFDVCKDYEKIIKKLPEIASDDCIVLACLNSTGHDTNFLKELFDAFAPEFKFVKRLQNVEEFQSADEERSLKNLIFQYCTPKRTSPF